MDAGMDPVDAGPCPDGEFRDDLQVCVPNACDPCPTPGTVARWSGLGFACVDASVPAATSGVITTNTCARPGAGAVNFHDYDETNLAPSYTMANGYGNDAQSITLSLAKWYPWTAAPTGQAGGTWYRFETNYLGSATDCDGDQIAESPALQVGHRYITPGGTLFEIGGQPRWECGDGTFNVYSDVDGGHEPIVIAPSSATSGTAYFSEWWQAANPLHATPAGYPSTSHQLSDIVDPATGSPVGDNYVYSQATVLAELGRVRVFVPGQGSKTYDDVVVVLWRHGTKFLDWGGGAGAPIQQFGLAPCGAPPSELTLDGWKLYGSVRFYARDKPSIGQQGGPIMDQLLWQCLQGSDGTWTSRGVLGGSSDQGYSWYRRWW